MSFSYQLFNQDFISSELIYLPPNAAINKIITCKDGLGQMQWTNLSSVAVTEAKSTNSNILINGDYNIYKSGSLSIALSSSLTNLTSVNTTSITVDNVYGNFKLYTNINLNNNNINNVGTINTQFCNGDIGDFRELSGSLNYFDNIYELTVGNKIIFNNHVNLNNKSIYNVNTIYTNNIGEYTAGNKVKFINNVDLNNNSVYNVYLINTQEINNSLLNGNVANFQQISSLAGYFNNIYEFTVGNKIIFNNHVNLNNKSIYNVNTIYTDNIGEYTSSNNIKFLNTIDLNSNNILNCVRLSNLTNLNTNTIIPYTNNTINLGDASNKFLSIYSTSMTNTNTYTTNIYNLANIFSSVIMNFNSLSYLTAVYSVLFNGEKIQLNKPTTSDTTINDIRGTFSPNQDGVAYNFINQECSFSIPNQSVNSTGVVNTLKVHVNLNGYVDAALRGGIILNQLTCDLQGNQNVNVSNYISRIVGYEIQSPVFYSSSNGYAIDYVIGCAIGNNPAFYGDSRISQLIGLYVGDCTASNAYNKYGLYVDAQNNYINGLRLGVNGLNLNNNSIINCTNAQIATVYNTSLITSSNSTTNTYSAQIDAYNPSGNGKIIIRSGSNSYAGELQMFNLAGKGWSIFSQQTSIDWNLCKLLNGGFLENIMTISYTNPVLQLPYGLQFQQNVVLNYYNTTSYTATITGAISTSVYIKISMVGNMVTLTLPSIVANYTTTNSIISISAMASDFRHSLSNGIINQIVGNISGVSSQMSYIVNSNGTINIGLGLNPVSPFLATTGDFGFYGFSISYTI
jgi:hypothetical protein